MTTIATSIYNAANNTVNYVRENPKKVAATIAATAGLAYLGYQNAEAINAAAQPYMAQANQVAANFGVRAEALFNNTRTFVEQTVNSTRAFVNEQTAQIFANATNTVINETVKVIANATNVTAV